MSLSFTFIEVYASNNYFNIKKVGQSDCKNKKVQFCWLLQLSTRTND